MRCKKLQNKIYTTLLTVIMLCTIPTIKVNQKPVISSNESSSHPYFQRLALRLEFLLKNDVNPNYYDETTGYTLLIMACMTNNLSYTMELLHKGANVNLTVCDGFSPLMAAAGGGHLELTKYLVESGADVFQTTFSYSETASDIAKRRCNYDISTYLQEIESKGQADYKTDNSLSILMNDGSFQEVIKFMDTHSICIDCNLYNGLPPLGKAIVKNRHDLVLAFIKEKASLNFKSNQGETPLILSASRSDHKMLQILIKYNLSTSDIDTCNKTVFCYSLFNFKKLKIILEHGIDFKANSNFDFNQFVTASQDLDFKSIKLILKYIPGSLVNESLFDQIRKNKKLSEVQLEELTTILTHKSEENL